MLRIKHTETKANGGWGNVVSCSTSGWFRCDSGRMLIYWRFFWWMHRLIVGRREQVAVVGSRRSRVLVMLTRLVALPGSAVWANAGPPTFLLPRSEMQPHAHMIFLYLGGNVLQCSSLEWWDHPWPNYSDVHGFTVLSEPPRWLCDWFLGKERNCLQTHVCYCTL